MTLLEKIQDLLAWGVTVELSREINQFKITLKKDDKEEIVVLPFDHLNEYKLVRYMDLLHEKLTADEKQD